MPLILPSSREVIFPKNSLIFLNDLKKLKVPTLSSPVGIYDLAYYLSSFSYVATTKKLDQDTLEFEKQVMQLALSYNPNLKFYIYIDGSEFVDSLGVQDLISSELLDISTIYNSSELLVSGVYVTGFDFQANFGAGHNPDEVNPITSEHYSGLTFRDVQTFLQITCSSFSLELSFSCNSVENPSPDADVSYSSGYLWVTNLPFVLKKTWKTIPNPPLYFQTNTILICTDLYGGNFNVSTTVGNLSYSASGYALTKNFMNNLMILNSIYSSNLNYNLKVMICVTADSVQSYLSPGFFTSGTALAPPLGIAYTVFLLTCWLGLDYICTSAYPDFYKFEEDDLTNVIFSFEDGYNYTQYYTPKSKLAVVNQSIIAYKNNLLNNIQLLGENTSSLVFNSGSTLVVNV